jgi:ribonuclease E
VTKEASEVKEAKAEVAAVEPAESNRAPDAQPETVPAAVAAAPPATPIGEKGRAANDPREVRRRQREAEMRDQGINK